MWFSDVFFRWFLVDKRTPWDVFNRNTLKKPPFTPPAPWQNGWCFSTLRRDCLMAPKIPIHLSNEKKTGCLGCIGYEILPSFMGIIINHYKDPYKPTRIQWKVIRFFFAHLALLGWRVHALNQVFQIGCSQEVRWVNGRPEGSDDARLGELPAVWAEGWAWAGPAAEHFWGFNKVSCWRFPLARPYNSSKMVLLCRWQSVMMDH